MYLSKAAINMLLRIGDNEKLYYQLLTTRELFAILELARKGLIKEAPNAECQTGKGNKKRCNRNIKAIYAELCLRFIPYFCLFLASFLFALSALLYSFPIYNLLGKLPLS